MCGLIALLGTPLPGKTLLAEAPGRALPRDLVGRTKTGFGIPVGRWLQQHSASNSIAMGSPQWSQRLASAYAGEML